MTLPLIRSVFGNSVPTLRIGISSETGLWDADENDGVSSNKFGLTSTLVHEIGHHMGFMSNVGDIGIAFNSITMLDVFRFPEDEGPAISAGEMQGAKRGLYENAPAIAGLGINTFDRVYGLSRGGPTPDPGEFQASHWDGIAPDPSTGVWSPIGIMNPFGVPGYTASQNGEYLTDADLSAFDTIGYVIDQNDVPQPVVDAILQFPGPLASIDPTGDTTFTWQASTNATGHYMYVNRVMANGDRDRVFASGTLASGATSVVVPANTLFAGRDYEWFVTAENGRGIALSGAVEFDTGDCAADVNNDGQVTPTDFTAWLNAFNTQAPGCDQNNDGQCTPTDFTAWVANYNAGC